MKARQQLRNILAEPGFCMAAGAYDGLSARLVQQAGFRAVYLTGGGHARACGYPDIGLLSLSEIVHWVGLCVEAVEIPVIADADNGYGNALNVIRTVREFEKTGVAALHLEAQVLPKKCGHYEGKALVETAEMVGKIRAAVDARRDADLVIIARTDARAVEGLAAAIDRVNAYLEAGADVGFVEAPTSEQELAQIPPRLNGPALANIFEGGKTPVLPAATLERFGYKLGVYPSQAQRAAIHAMQQVLKSLLEQGGDTRRIEDRLASFAEREQIVDTAAWRRLEDRYLRST
ncbi:MAG: oxaloacetate decarboxylase [Burkholderiales bacterium]|nr:MAG: oxaloacetate decarboxylase [Burkholderiales bacterium]